MRLLACASAIAALTSSAALAQPPSIDIRNTCKYAASAMVQLMGGSAGGNDQEICLGSEDRAREQLVKDWSTYSATDKSRCVRTRTYLPSYTEWLTCLEMERDVRKMNFGEENATGVMTMPVIRLGPLW